MAHWPVSALSRAWEQHRGLWGNIKVLQAVGSGFEPVDYGGLLFGVSGACEIVC